MQKIIMLSVPIGNLSDLTPRVRQALESGKYYLVEDTRVFKSLVSQVGISLEHKFITSFHDHTEKNKLDHLLNNAPPDEIIYLVSDAGSPMISDPAYPLISYALQRGYEIETYPGVSSVIVALELSGLPAIPFHFHGFLPREHNKIISAFDALDDGETHVFFESPHRILSTCEILAKSHPDAQVALARELTKIYQSVYRFEARNWDNISKEVMVKGEFTLVVYEPSKKLDRQINLKDVVALSEDILKNGSSRKKLSQLLASVLGKSSKDIYKILDSEQ